MQGAERYGAPEENQRERKRTRSYSGYVALLCDFIDKEPSNYEEAAERKQWKDVMIKEYQSIMKNDVSDVVPRPEGKSIVTSKWIYTSVDPNPRLYQAPRGIKSLCRYPLI